MSLKSALISGALALLSGLMAGYWLCNLQWEAKDARMNESQAQEETKRLEKAMEENRNLHEAVSQMQIRLKKENDDAKRENDLLLARINRGNVRVSIPARACSDLPNNGHPGTDSGKARAELDPEVVERILAVGRDGDAAIRDLNLCVEQYREVVEVGGKKKTPPKRGI